MNSTELSAKVLRQLAVNNADFTPPKLSEKQKRNAANVMQEIPLQRLQASGQQLVRQRGLRYKWGDGIILNRNSRVGDTFWTNMPPAQLDELKKLTASNPSIFLFCYFAISQSKLHVWAIPDDIAIQTIAKIPINKSELRTIIIDPNVHRICQVSDSPFLLPFYREIQLSTAELESLAAGIKQDAAAKEFAVAANVNTSEDIDEDESVVEPDLGDLYTQQTVDFMLTLPEHTTDGEWHARHRDTYASVLRNPTSVLVDRLRDDTVSKLDPAVAAASHNVSVLRKNDYGRGGYYDHYWAAFYDPAAKSKTKSCQLFFSILGGQRQFRYGFAFGNYCEKYIANLSSAIAAAPKAVQEYLELAIGDVVVETGEVNNEQQFDLLDYANRVNAASGDSGHVDGTLATPMAIIRSFPLEELPERAETLATEIGDLFRWVWPFFQAARTGVWNPSGDNQAVTIEDLESIDEDAPRSLSELSDISALSIERLQEIEDALLTKQQIVLTGPPGTSKTYIAQLFARYFAVQREGHSQGSHSTLFMHANWAYEDFFEGIKPFTADGVLKFEPKLGYFLEWVQSLQGLPANARHVLVLDEINRCDTAAVLGELLQLLEYRGREVRLLSGRLFRFPSNVYIIGTMNSADRSIGRLDLALRRRFLWLDLVPDYTILHTWLGRTGNNPAKFSADSLKKCNLLLEDRGIRVEQQIGHALFMLQTFGSETQAPKDKPLIPEALRRIVRFSVIPYVKELCVMQLGRVDAGLVTQIEQALLACIADGTPDAGQADSLDEPRA